MNHLYLQLAYIATWLIHIAYIVFLTFTFRRPKREFEELERGKK